MASLNQCAFIGNLGRDPEMKYLTSGDAVVNFSIACNNSYKNKDGEKVESVQWVRLVAFGKLAEIIGEYLKSGSQVYVAGRMQTRDYEKEGQKHYSTEIVVDKLVMLGGRRDGEQAEPGPREPSQSTRPTKGPAAKTQEEMDDSASVPF